MGSYNVTCSASNISISPGDRVRVFALVRSKYAENLEGPYLVSNEGAEAMFRSLYYPVLATYDDYGRVIDIAESPTTRMIEKYTGLDIYKYLNESLLEWRGDEIESNIETDASMFVLEDIYQAMISHCRDDNNLYDESFAVVYSLEKLGFEFYEVASQEQMEKPDEPHGLKRYAKLYKHHSSDKYFIGADNFSTRFIELLSNGKYHSHGGISTYSVRQLFSVWQSHTGFALDAEPLKKIPTSTYRVKHEIEKYQKGIDRNQKDLLEEIRDLESSSDPLGYIRKSILKKKNAMAKNKYLPGYFYEPRDLFGREYEVGDFPFNLYGPVMSGEQGEEELSLFIQEAANFSDFKRQMYMVNRMFQPCITGPQCGEYTEAKKLAVKIAELCFKKEVELS